VDGQKPHPDFDGGSVTLDEAKVVLEKAMTLDGTLECLKPFLFWKPGQDRVTIDGKFTARQLEAVAVLMRSGGEA
jgi:hypothetical protein